VPERRFNFTSGVFPVDEIDVGGERELIVRGGRDKFTLLPQALDGIRNVSVIGWGSQGPAQAQNLKESFAEAGMSTSVGIGLRRGSSNWQQAVDAGFSEDDGTLGEVFDMVEKGDLVLLLIADSAQAELYPEILRRMKTNATLGLSHGFLLGVMSNDTASFRSDLNVVGVCPKGMGASVRRLYEQGKTVNGAGINSSFAVHQDATGNATDIALGWSIAIGSPVTFATSLEREYKSDIFGERVVLLGGIHGMCEALYRRFVANGMSRRRIQKHR
jgi:ketol-acid reductoisomerase